MKHLEGQELIDYLRSLKPGERVRETSRSAIYNREGDVYLNERGDICVLWDEYPGEGGRMGTTVTGGARRVSDLANDKADPADQ